MPKKLKINSFAELAELAELAEIRKNISISKSNQKPISTKTESISIGEIWIKFLLNEISMTAGEVNSIKNQLSSLLDLTNDQFETFNTCLRERSIDYNNSRLDYRKLNKEQLVYLENILNLIRKRVSIFKEVGVQGNLGKCLYCKSRMGLSKTIFSTKNHANTYAMYLKEKLFHNQIAYKCPSGDGWHLKSD